MWFYFFARDVMRYIVTPLFYRVKVEGRENIPADKGFLVCSNHVTNYDPVFIGSYIKGPLRFMAKEELFHNPVVALVLRSVGAFPIKRGSGDNEAIDTAKEILSGGGVMVMFPEGTRSKTGELMRPKSGAAFLAVNTGCDVLPAAVIFKGTPRIFRRVTIRYGRIIKNEDLGYDTSNPRSIRIVSKVIMDGIAKELGVSN